MFTPVQYNFSTAGGYCGWQVWTLNNSSISSLDSLMFSLDSKVNTNATFCLYTAWQTWNFSTFFDRHLEMLHKLYGVYMLPMLSCSIGGSVSLSICHPLSPLTYFCYRSHLLLFPWASCWPSNPLQHLARGPLVAGQWATVQTNIRQSNRPMSCFGIMRNIT